MILKPAFFERDVLRVAEDLLGAHLVRRVRGKEVRHVITEVEAYDGIDDKACHASKGRTPRTEVMFGPAGHWYVYLCYGMYDMLNIVTGQEGYPAAVLIRGTREVNGPGRLTKALGITRALNGQSADKQSGLWIERSGIRMPKKEIVRTPRIGVGYAGEWARKPWRFVWREDVELQAPIRRSMIKI